MEIGTILPQLALSMDATELRHYAQTAEQLGYRHLQVFDRVLAVNPADPDWDGPYDNDDSFHEPMVLLGHLAAVTEELKLTTGILVLPQRKTAVVAKQAAEVDVLSEGRLRLGVGVGWNPREFADLNADFETRGRRIEEQIELLRRLWTEEIISFDGEWESVNDQGINPLPVQQPIPIWMGGSSDRTLRRIAEMGEGWLTPRAPLDEVEDQLDRLRSYCREAGRDPDEVAIAGRMNLGSGGPTSAEPDEWIDRARHWADLGATQMMVETTDMGLETAEDHVRLLYEFHDRATDAGLSFGP